MRGCRPEHRSRRGMNWSCRSLTGTLLMSKSPNYTGAILGKPLERTSGELDSLVDNIRRRALRCRSVIEIDGDRRFWDVDVSQSPCLSRLMEFAHQQIELASGRLPRASVVMVNHIDASRTSGG